MAATFETGASTAAANNLILCVTNTAQDYPLRRHAGFRALELGYENAYAHVRELANARACAERKAARGRFSARDVSEAARLLLAQSIDDAKASILENWTGGNFHVTGRKWFDRANGNSYHSASITVPTNDSHGRIIGCPLQYGYGDQWRTTALQALESLGFKRLRHLPYSQMPVVWVDQGYMRKCDAFGGMREFSF